MTTAKRRAFKTGASKAVTLPKSCRIGETVAMVSSGAAVSLLPFVNPEFTPQYFSQKNSANAARRQTVLR